MPLESLASVFEDQPISTAPPIAASASVAAAVTLMSTRNVDALMAMDGGSFAGIITTQDVIARVLAAQRDLVSTRIADVISSPPAPLPVTTRVEQALRLMNERACHHVAVDSGGQAPCVLSRLDLATWIIRSQREQLDCAIGAVKQLTFGNRRG